MTSSWTLLVNTGSRTCKVTLYDDAGADATAMAP